MEEKLTVIQLLCCIEQHNIIYVLQDCIEDKPMQCAQINRVGVITLGRTGSWICEKIINTSVWSYKHHIVKA